MPMLLTPRQILDRLVAFPTVSRDSNLALIGWVEDYLASHGVAAQRVWNTERTKAAVYANIGPQVTGGVVLSGHSDVVPVDGQSWTTDPWSVVERDGRLYGRGTCDMKGFVALALAAVPLALAAGVKRPLQIAISYDEEVGCTGAPAMIAEMAQVLPRASAVLVGEPSMLRMVNGHKGGTKFSCHVKGFEVHSSIMHEGVNAIMVAARLIDWANRMNAENRARPASPLAALFNPPWTTVHVGVIHGGTAHNITAGDCWFGLDFRVVPGERLEDWVAAFRAEVDRIEKEIKAIRPEAAISLEQDFVLPPLQPETDGAAEALVRRLTGDNSTSVVSYGTEAGQFQAAGYSAVVCGPGDIAQAHQPDEYLELAQFEAGWVLMQRLVAELAA
ncbi:acetylornithine deacetylase [Rhodobacter ferrooxidans]|uniref:Acetylornithine deacetylase (ArgE) n=1 Tax=Rhodobacter ferrooxidans TaxID=371731 RepID=C8RY59_9RHOB|nr:acetylornithine deacetylase [Rhodobacter sp. SW2]EEW26457.1 acetylornithine deacetylase (ArgE) [Rhodobacter sp. SW2]